MSCGRSKEEVNARRRELVERFLASDMDVKPWCKLNGVYYQTMYDWLAHYRESDPDLFGGYEIAHAGDGRAQWFRCVRRAMRESRAIAPAAPAPEPRPAAFAVVDTAGLLAPAAPREEPRGPERRCVTVRFAGVEVDVPLGCEDSLAAVIRAARSL